MTARTPEEIAEAIFETTPYKPEKLISAIAAAIRTAAAEARAAALEEVREMLEPMAKAADNYESLPDDLNAMLLTIGQLRRARDLYRALKDAAS